MTKDEFISRIEKVMENPEAKEAMKKAATAEEMIKAAALAGVSLTAKDLQEAAETWKVNGEELSDFELDMVAAAGNRELDKALKKLIEEIFKNPIIFKSRLE